jgi:hypothetical protein
MLSNSRMKVICVASVPVISEVSFEDNEQQEDLQDEGWAR